MTLTITPVDDLPEIDRGADLAALIAARADLLDGDVVVVSQKIVSKAEGAVIPIEPGEDIAAARRRHARAEARRVVVDTPEVLVVETRHGFVCANAGLDTSNAAPQTLVRLPDDPDASAARLRQGLLDAAGVEVAVVVADTFGRPWRMGQTDVAIGVAGLAPLRDERGGTDRGGAVLEVTEIAVADEVAAAADLVRRKADGVPVVVVRGLVAERTDAASARELVRPAALDLFRRGRGQLAADLATCASGALGPPVPAAAIERARRAVAGLDVIIDSDRSGATLAVTAADAAHAGLAAGLLVAALVDAGYRARARSARPDEAAMLVIEAGVAPQSRADR